jgi:hypothetical protein
MNSYRIEYTEKGIPGILCKYVTGTEELLNVLLKLKYFDKLESFDNIKVCSLSKYFNFKRTFNSSSVPVTYLQRMPGIPFSVYSIR